MKQESLRIPYMGSKQKISNWVLDNIIETLGIESKSGYELIDLFGGGGAITLKASIYYPQFSKVVYNEIQQEIAALLKALTTGELNHLPHKLGEVLPDVAYKWVTREEFKEIISPDSSYPLWYKGLVQSCWSFGSKGNTYNFSPENAKLKKWVHEIVVNRNVQLFEELETEEFSPPASIIKAATIRERLTSFRAFRRETLGRGNHSSQRHDMGHLERVQHLERLKQLQEIEALNHLENISNKNVSPFKKLEIHSEDYLTTLNGLKPNDSRIIYCDPPYAGTTQYSKTLFNSKLFWEEISKVDAPVFVSEYSIPEEYLKTNGGRWSTIAEVEKKSTLAGGSHSHKSPPAVEKLYWNGSSIN